MWRVGQRVICVNGQFPAQFFEWGDRTPEEGSVYTIRKISQGCHGVTGQTALSFLLEEIVNPHPDGYAEVMFSACRFRPLSEEQPNRAAAGSERQVNSRMTGKSNPPSGDWPA